MFVILVHLCCKENTNARHIFPPIPHIHLIFWPVNLKCIYRHSDSLTTHTLICIWLCIHAWGPLKGEAFCVRALDVMRGGNSGTEPVWWPHTATGRGRHPSGNGCCEDVSAGVFVMYPPYQPPVADKLLIKQKLDTETNYCIVLLCGFDPRPRTECGTSEGTKKERS